MVGRKLVGKGGGIKIFEVVTVCMWRRDVCHNCLVHVAFMRFQNAVQRATLSSDTFFILFLLSCFSFNGLCV